MWLYNVGPQWAKRLMLTGDSITGAEAQQIGLVLKAVPKEHLEYEVEQLADRLCKIDPDLLSTNKRIINMGLELMGARTLQRMAAENDVRGHNAKAATGFRESVAKVGLRETLAQSRRQVRRRARARQRAGVPRRGRASDGLGGAGTARTTRTPPKAQAMEVLQLLLSGVSHGCVYGLIALGFVLIYKATEMLNFAQGELMMVGAFVAFTLVNLLGLPFLLGFAVTLVCHDGFRHGVGARYRATDDRRAALRRVDAHHRSWLRPARRGGCDLGQRAAHAGCAVRRRSAGGGWRRGGLRQSRRHRRHGAAVRGVVAVLSLFAHGRCHAGRVSESAGRLLQRRAGEARHVLGVGASRRPFRRLRAFWWRPSR